MNMQCYKNTKASRPSVITNKGFNLSRGIFMRMVCDLIQATSDNHVGHFFMKYMREKDPDDICQIDAATGKQETRRSMLSRCIRLARCLRNLGLQPGDVLVLGGKNHLDGHIPFYAALLNGLPMAGVDPLFRYTEIKQLFEIVEPKIAFCQYEMYDDYRRAAQDLGLSTKIVTFDAGECTLAKFMEEYGSSEPEDQFEVAHVDVTKVYCWLVSTSGTTGFPKVVALSHSNVLQNLAFFLIIVTDETKTEHRAALNMSSIQWISACYNVLAIPIDHIKLQTSAPATTEHVIDIINKYRPVKTFATATLFAPILSYQKYCDLTCFKLIILGGSKIHVEFLNTLRTRLRHDAQTLQVYGQSESGGTVLQPSLDGPIGNLGTVRPDYELKLVDPDTGRIITEPNVVGELWWKGPRMECYYRNPIATAEAFSEDGFFKSGDLLYRDENDYYFFVDRRKMLLNYRGYKIIPPEIEEPILSHKAVMDVCVTGLPHPDHGEVVVACVVRRPGAHVTAQEIKDHVANQLSEPKHLHGGVVFMDKLPFTSTGKIARNKVREIVLTAKRE